MTWWTIPMVLLAAPALLLALAGWVLRAAFRQVCASVAPRPEESERDALSAPAGHRSFQGNRIFARRAGRPIAVGGEPDRWTLN